MNVDHDTFLGSIYNTQATHNNDTNDLANQLNSFSISTTEERLTQQLNKTHIAATTTTPSIFALPSQFQQQAQQSAETRSTFVLPPPQTTTVNTTSDSDWNGNEWDAIADWTGNSNTTKKDNDGWGEGPPSYTAITQGTYFGFNSIMEAPTRLAPTTTSTTEENSTNEISQTQAQAFSRYKNTPITFTSAAAAQAAQAQAQAQAQATNNSHEMKE